MDVGNTVGKAIKVDLTTQDASRAKFARVCVEVNLARPLLPSVTIYGYRQPVEYEGLHQICFKCGQYGHKLELCTAVTELPSTDPSTASSSHGPSNPGGESSYGPWMLPNRGRRWRPYPAPDGVRPTSTGVRHRADRTGEPPPTRPRACPPAYGWAPPGPTSAHFPCSSY